MEKLLVFNEDQLIELINQVVHFKIPIKRVIEKLSHQNRDEDLIGFAQRQELLNEFGALWVEKMNFSPLAYSVFNCIHKGQSKIDIIKDLIKIVEDGQKFTSGLQNALLQKQNATEVRP